MVPIWFSKHAVTHAAPWGGTVSNGWRSGCHGVQVPHADAKAIAAERLAVSGLAHTVVITSGEWMSDGWVRVTPLWDVGGTLGVSIGSIP